jgi:MtaA/CmuA family methyltransferase
MMFATDRVGRPYRDYATDYRVLVEGQLRVAEEFDADHVSVISDPGCEAADHGATIQYFDNQPPAIDEVNALLMDRTVLATLEAPDPLGGGRMTNRVNAVAQLKERVGGDLAIEGWVEGPCAESADLRGINHFMMDFYDDPGFAQDLIDYVIETAMRFAEAQIEAGATYIGVGDAAASLVGPQIYDEYIWAAEKKLVDHIQSLGAGVRLHICGNTTPLLEGMGKLGCDMVDLDFMVSLADARAAMGPDQVLTGNIDPVTALWQGTPESIQDALAVCYEQAGPRYIVGAGCEVVRDTPHENLRAMAEFAQSHT